MAKTLASHHRLGLYEAIDLVEVGGEKNWAKVLENLPFLANWTNFYWAYQSGVAASNAGTRELAALLLGCTTVEIESKQLPVVLARLQGCLKDDESSLVRYRAAIALWRRGEKSPKVKKVLHLALNEPTVAPLATECLEEVSV